MRNVGCDQGLSSWSLAGVFGKFLGACWEFFCFWLASCGRFFLGVVAISCLEAWTYGVYNRRLRVGGGLLGIYVLSCFVVRVYMGLHECGNILGRGFLPEVVVVVGFRMILGKNG